MKCYSKKIPVFVLPRRKAFSLIEVVTALAILALVCSSVLVVINRCITSAADSVLRMQAFEIARENMEKLLAKDSVAQMVEYGSSDKYPEIQWQTTVDSFYEPLTSRMWIRAVCSAEYTDTDDEQQTVKLTHWLTSLTKEQILKIVKEKQKEKERLAEQIIEMEKEAADYAGVDVQTIRQWVENGMLETKAGHYIKGQLDLYKQSGGRPTIEARNRQAQADADLIGPAKEQAKQGEQTKSEKSEVKLICGYTIEEIYQMDFQQVWNFLWSCDEF